MASANNVADASSPSPSATPPTTTPRRRRPRRPIHRVQDRTRQIACNPSIIRIHITALAPSSHHRPSSRIGDRRPAPSIIIERVHRRGRVLIIHRRVLSGLSSSGPVVPSPGGGPSSSRRPSAPPRRAPGPRGPGDAPPIRPWRRIAPSATIHGDHPQGGVGDRPRGVVTSHRMQGDVIVVRG